MSKKTISSQDALRLKEHGWKFDWSIPHKKGYVQFTAKSDLISHYQNTLMAKPIDWHNMYIDSYGALLLINKYFKGED